MDKTNQDIVENLKANDIISIFFEDMEEHKYKVVFNQHKNEKVFIKYMGKTEGLSRNIIIEYADLNIYLLNDLPGVIVHGIRKISIDNSTIVDEQPPSDISIIDELGKLQNLVFDIITEDIIKEKKISKWEQKLDIFENKEEIKNLLHTVSTTYKKGNITTHIQDYIHLIDSHKQDIDHTHNITHIKESDADNFRPYYDKIIKNDFRNTNIYPIIIDKQILYIDEDDDEIQQLSDELQNKRVFKQYAKMDFIDKIIKERDIKEENYKSNDEELNKVKKLEEALRENNINKSHLLPDTTGIQYKYHKIDLHDNIVLYRNNYKKYKATTVGSSIKYITDELQETAYLNLNFKITETKDNKNHKSFISIKADDIEIEKNYNTIITRKATKSIYTLQDHFSDIKLNKKRGLKSAIQTCGGTSKNGEKIYIDNNLDSELNHSLNRHPVKSLINNTNNKETTYVCGFFIRSPHKERSVIINGEEKIRDATTKYYPENKSRGVSLLDTTAHSSKKNIHVVENIDEFNIYNYDPKLDYYVLFGKKNTDVSKLTNDDYKKAINKILPTILDIIYIERERLKEVSSVEEIELIINKYGLQYKDLITSLKKYLNGNILTNITTIKQLLEKTNNYKSIEIFYNYIFEIINTQFDEHKTESDPEEMYKSIKAEIMLKIPGDWVDCLKNITIILKLPESELGIEEQFKVFLKAKLVDQRLKSNIINNFILDSEDFKDLDVHLYDKLQRFKTLNKLTTKFRYSFNERFTNYEMNMLTLIQKSKNDYKLNQQLIKLLKLQSIYTLDKQLKTPSTKHYNITRNVNLLPIYSVRVKLITEMFNNYVKILEIFSKYNGVVFYKHYKSLEMLQNDNGGDIYVDTYSETYLKNCKALFENLKKEKIIREKELNMEDFKSYLGNIYLSINNSFLNKIFEDVKMYMADSITNISIKEGDIALLSLPAEDTLDPSCEQISSLESGGKYLFERISRKWVCLTKHKYDMLLEKSESKYIEDYDKNLELLLKISYEEWLDLSNCGTYDKTTCEGIEIDDELVNIYDNDDIKIVNDVRLENIPIKMYNFFKSISNLNTKITQLKILQTYDAHNTEHKESTNNDLENKFNYTAHLNYKQKKLNRRLLSSNKETITRPPPLLKEQLLRILDNKDFDDKIDNLYEFIEIYGSDYSVSLREKINVIYVNKFNSKEKEEIYQILNELGLKDSYYTHITDKQQLINILLKTKYPDAYSISSKKIYYHSLNIEEALCCKHYLAYRPLLYKTGKSRTIILNKIKDKFGILNSGVHICKDCGELLDYETYSNFEGFNSANKVMVSREAVIEEIPIFDINSLNFSTQTRELFHYSTKIINKILSSFGIILYSKDLNFIYENIAKQLGKIGPTAFIQIMKRNNIFTTFIDEIHTSNEKILKRIKSYTKDRIKRLGNKAARGGKKLEAWVNQIHNSLYQNNTLETKQYLKIKLADLIIKKRQFNKDLHRTLEVIIQDIKKLNSFELNILNIDDICSRLKETDTECYAKFKNYYELKDKKTFEKQDEAKVTQLRDLYDRGDSEAETFIGSGIKKKHVFNLAYMFDTNYENYKKLYKNYLHEMVFNMTVNYLSQVIVYATPEYKLQTDLIDSVALRQSSTFYSPDGNGKLLPSITRLQGIILDDILSRHVTFNNNPEKYIKFTINRTSILEYTRTLISDKYFIKIKKHRESIYLEDKEHLKDNKYIWGTFLPDLNHGLEYNPNGYSADLNNDSKLNIESRNYISLLNNILSKNQYPSHKKYINSSMYDRIDKNYLNKFKEYDTDNKISNVIEHINTLSQGNLEINNDRLFNIENYSKNVFTTITSLSKITKNNLKILLNTYKIIVVSGENITDIIDKPLNELLKYTFKLQKRSLVNINIGDNYDDIIDISAIKETIQEKLDSPNGVATKEITLFDVVEGILMITVYEKFAAFDVDKIKKIFTIINNINKVPVFAHHNIIISKDTTIHDTNELIRNIISSPTLKIIEDYENFDSAEVSINIKMQDYFPLNIDSLGFNIEEILEECNNKIDNYYVELKTTMENNYKMNNNTSEEELKFRQNNIIIQKRNTKTHIFLKILQKLLFLTNLITNNYVNDQLYEFLGLESSEITEVQHPLMCVYKLILDKSHCKLYRTNQLDKDKKNYKEATYIKNLKQKYTCLRGVINGKILTDSAVSWDKISDVKLATMKYINEITAKYSLATIDNIDSNDIAYYPQNIIDITVHLTSYILTLYSEILETESIDTALVENISELLKDFIKNINDSVDIYSIRNDEIFADITLYRTGKSDKRKEDHDKLPPDQQNAKKMFRMFNMGKNYKQSLDVDTTTEAMPNTENVQELMSVVEERDISGTISTLDDTNPVVQSTGDYDQNEALQLSSHSVEENGDAEY
tara:strand:- start:4849 stop:12000 length:7152 start_codon:yes stop_codon:yes gene_type:complete